MLYLPQAQTIRSRRLLLLHYLIAISIIFWYND